MGRWRKKLLAVCIGLAPLILLEAGLWIGGYEPREHGYFQGFDGFDGLFESVGGEWRVAPAWSETFRTPPFPREKAARHVRIVSVGDSVVWGHAGNEADVPLQSYSEALEVRLRATGRDISVLNCGARTYASRRVRRVVDEIVDVAPDVVIASFGSSEFLEANAAQASQKRREFDDSALGRWKTLRLVASWLQRGQRGRWGLDVGALAARDDTLTAAFTRGGYTLPDDSARERLLDEARANLDAIVARCRSAGVPLVLLTVPAHLRWPPFAHRLADTSAREDVHTAIRNSGSLLDAGRPADARVLLEPLVAAHPENAALHYRLGQSWDAESRWSEAAAAYRRARDLDACPLRALSAFNEIVRATARDAENVYLLDVEQVFAALVPDGIPDGRLFIDHCHPDESHHDVIAAALEEILVEHRLVSPASAEE